MNKYVIWAFGVAIIVMGGYLLLNNSEEEQTSLGQQVERQTQTVSYRCAEDLTMVAGFNGETLVLSLLDGRQLVLQHAEAASGAKYANAKGTLVFWTKGDSAFFEEFGTKTYQDCIAQSEQ